MGGSVMHAPLHPSLLTSEGSHAALLLAEQLAERGLLLPPALQGFLEVFEFVVPPRELRENVPMREAIILRPRIHRRPRGDRAAATALAAAAVAAVASAVAAVA